jgi:gamma-glutamyltranspeptidase
MLLLLGRGHYYTITPAMGTDPVDGSLSLVFGVMGGFMQPQGSCAVAHEHAHFWDESAAGA